MGHDHHHAHAGHFPYCRFHHTHQSKDCTCEIVTPIALVVVTVIGFSLQLLLARWASSVALAGDAWHTLYDGADNLLWLLVVILIRAFAFDEHRTRDVGAIIAFFLLVFAVGIVSYASIGKLVDPTPTDPVVMLFGGLLGVILGIAGVGIARITPKERRSVNHQLALGHVLQDLLVSVGVCVAATCMLLLDAPHIDGIVGLLIAIYLAFSFLPRYFRILMGKE